MKHMVLVFFAAFLFSSCSVVNHLDEVATLQEFAKEQNALSTMAEKQNRKFSGFLDRIKAGTDLPDLKDRSAVLNYLGKPVLVETIEQHGIKKERWLYRYQELTMDSPKVYFVISPDGGVDYWLITSSPRFTMPSIDVIKRKPQP